MADSDTTQRDEIIAEFCKLTSASSDEARQYLTANQWNMDAAVGLYFAVQEAGPEQDLEEGNENSSSAPDSVEQPYTGPRTLDGRPAPEAIPSVPSSSRTTAPPRRTGGIATLGSIAKAPANHGHAHDDDDDDDDDYDPQEYHTGGEKSGLAVQDPSNNDDPRKIVNDIIKKATANAPQEGGPSSARNAAPRPPTHFRGTGHTVGGDNSPSQEVPGAWDSAAASTPASSAPVQRTLHLWQDGFSVDDGELRRFDDPRNAQDLAFIRSGRAPIHIMGVQPEQAVDVQLVKHEENYKPPPKVYKPFSGSGQRLGTEPTAPISPTSTSTHTRSTKSQQSQSSSVSAAPENNIDDSIPTVTLRIQLANGTRLPARFNTTQTIGDIYDFIARAMPGGSGRSWVLATTFPNKDHTDKSLVIGEITEFKRGGTAVQKWS